MTPWIPEDHNLPFVGRLRQIDQLRQVLRAGQDGHVQTVFIQGEAGIGKTRLVSVAAAEASQDGWLVLRGRSQTVGEGLAFAPIIEAFRIALQGMNPTQKSHVGEAYPYLNALFPNLGSSVPVLFLNPALERTRLFETLRMFTVYLAAEFPLYIWLDDLPDADSDTLEWLQYCVQHTGHGRIVFIATCRTSFTPPSSAYLQLETYFLRHGFMQTIQLEALPDSESIELMKAQLDGQIQGETLNALSSRTLGVPLYILEVVRVLIHSGGLRIQNGSWELEDGADKQVPPSITSLLEHRMNNLTPTEREVLSLLAVSNSSVPWILLHKAIGLDSAILTDSIHGLLQRGVLREEINGNELAYDFRHPMIKAVTHSRISQILVQQAHSKLAGAWFDHDVSRAAFHILASGDSVDGESSARMLFEAGKRYLSLRSYQAAVEYLEQAAQLANQRFVSITAELLWNIRLTLSEALTYVDRAQQALLLLDELFYDAKESSTKIRLKSLMAWVESTRSYEECLRHIAEGLEWWDGLNENKDVFWMLNERVFNDMNSGNPLDAETSLQALQRYGKAFPSTRTSLLCLIRETHVALLSWKSPSTIMEQADRMLTEARKLDEPELIYDVYCLMGYAALNQGNYKTALRYSMECAGLVRRNGMVVHEVSVRMVGMCALFMRGDWEQSMQEVEAVEMLAREYEFQAALLCILDLKALILVLQGKWKEGSAIHQESENLEYQVFPSGGPQTDSGSLHVLHAVKQLLTGSLPESNREPKTVYWANTHGMQLFLKLVQGLWLLQAGLAEPLTELLNRLKAVVPEGQPSYVFGIIELLSGLQDMKSGGDPKHATERLTNAMRTFEALRTPLELAVARMAWAQGTDPERAKPAIQQSLDEFRRLGALGCAEWVEQLMRQTNNRTASLPIADSLTNRETEILRALASGFSNKEIALRFGLTEGTVKNHVFNLYSKLGVNRRSQAIARARELRIWE
jgi:DNA-binding CsgD family transcriptional regulator/tetratricopeptide (TPR) repeat protein